jgi:hypothetical protein
MSDEVETMRESIRAVAAVPAQLASFGVERVTERDGLWLERLSIRGGGRVRLSSNRSFGDASGEEIGCFEGDLADARAAKLVRDVEAALPGGPAPNLSPGDVRVTLSVVAAGARWERLVGGGPPDLEPYQPLLRTLDALAFEARARPVRTLALNVQLGAPLRAGEQSVPVELTFENRGTAGYWLRNPSSGLADEPTEHVRLWYAARPPEEPGVTALPVEPIWVPLEPMTRAQRPFIWIGPRSSETRRFTASLILDAGPHFVRGGFASYDGGDTVAGQPHLRGCAFSRELEVEVSS